MLARRVNSYQTNARAYAQVLGVLVRLDARTFLNEQQLRQLLAAGTSCLPEASASQLVAQLWSLSCLRFLPPRAWMAQWSQCMRRQARGLSPTGLAAVLVAHARFGLRPPRELLQVCVNKFMRPVRMYCT